MFNFSKSLFCQKSYELTFGISGGLGLWLDIKNLQDIPATMTLEVLGMILIILKFTEKAGQNNMLKKNINFSINVRELQRGMRWTVE